MRRLRAPTMAALLLAAAHAAFASPVIAAPPCAGCVTWRAAPAAVRLLLDGPARLDGLDVLVTAEAGPGEAEALAAARGLVARGATVGVEEPAHSSSDLRPWHGLAARLVLQLAEDAAADEATVLAVRMRATAARAALPDVAVGLGGPADTLRVLADRVAPYVAFFVPSPPGERKDAPLDWWAQMSRVGSVDDVLARTAAASGRRLLLPLGEGDVPAARHLASLADVFPPGLTALETVRVTSERDGREASVFLHPRTLDAIVLVEGGAWLVVRPGATRAHARPLGPTGAAEAALPLTAGSEAAEIDARAVTGPIVVRLAGWAGGDLGFTAALDVTAARSLSVAEILAAHQAAVVRQAARLRTLVATGTTVLTFQVPGLAAPMTVTAGTVLYRRGDEAEIEQRDLRLNGVPVAVGDDGVPRLPLVQPERAASPPLSITLGEAYAYRLDGEDVKAGQACYVVAFEPRETSRPSYRGRAWIAKEGFALVRMEATQTGLRGAIVSSRQEDEYRPMEAGDTRAWLLVRSDVEQVYEGPGHRTPIHRRIAFDAVEVNPLDFEARLRAARASRSVMMRETAEGFRYLRRVADAPAETRREGATPDDAGQRTLAGRAPRLWSVALGTLFDPNIDGPLPFAGLSYVDFDVLGTGAQMSALVAGPFAQVAISVPSAFGPGRQIQAWAFAALARYNDRSFRGGLERYDENLSQRPMRGSVAAVQRLGARARMRLAYDFDAVRLGRNGTTAADFRVPTSPVAHAARVGLEWEHGPWSATVWGSAARRQAWRAWGHAGDFSPEARTYERAGVSLTRSFVLSPTLVTRVEGSALFGHDLDRFSRFGFDAFDSRLRGYPSAGVRFDRGAVLRTAATWAARRAVRLGGFLDAAIVDDPTTEARHDRHLGTGLSLETALPGRVLLGVDWGFGLEARGRDGRRGTHVLRITAYKVL